LTTQNAILVAFDLDPLVNWPNDEEFARIRRLERDGLIRETCPSKKAWHFNVLDPAAEQELPAVCFKLSHWHNVGGEEQ
jgi:hypothetical protein